MWQWPPQEERLTSFLPLGRVCEQRDRSTAGSARFFSGDPTISPCTRRPSLSFAPDQAHHSMRLCGCSSDAQQVCILIAYCP